MGIKMNPDNLGRLKKINLRNVFVSEPGDFTPWLAEDKNLQLLGETIGLELELESQEKNVGPYRADLLCKEITTDSYVLIENQLEKTDHTHLGQLLTYAAGLDAVSIIWVASVFSEQHRAALDWLNEHTDDHINLFGLEVELWSIGDSAVAPKFNIVSKPNNWSRAIKKTSFIPQNNIQRIQMDYWTSFVDYLSGTAEIDAEEPRPRHWLYFETGISGCRLVSNIKPYEDEPEIRVEVRCMGRNGKSMYEALYTHRDEIEKELGLKLSWRLPEDTKNSQAYISRVADFKNRLDWSDQFKWMASNLKRFLDVFRAFFEKLEK